MRISPLGVSLHDQRMYFFSVHHFLSEIPKLISKDFLLFHFKDISVALWYKIFGQRSILFSSRRENCVMQDFKSWFSVKVFLEELVANEIVQEPLQLSLSVETEQ